MDDNLERMQRKAMHSVYRHVDLDLPDSHVADTRLPRSGSRNSSMAKRSSALALCVCAFGLAGCGAGTMTAKPRMGAIQFTDANGNAATTFNSFKVGAGGYFDAVLSDDSQMLGINWTVSCSSALPPGSPLPPGQTVDESCGTFTATHTATAPVPSYATSGNGVVTFYQAPVSVPSTGTVTVYASATSDPSIFSSVSFTVIGLPISIGFAPGPPSSLAENATAQIGALVSNDSSMGGVNWSVTCASVACGTFSAASTPSVTKTIYTAPAAVPSGGMVTITATSMTDPTKSVSAEVAISQAVAAGASGTDSATDLVAGPGLWAEHLGESR